MQTTERRAIDLAPGRPLPGLALALALLSIPGSTLAWELPSGGFWIGLPLAVAAIVLAMRCLRRLGRSRMAVAAIAISVLTIGLMAVWTAVSVASAALTPAAHNARDLFGVNSTLDGKAVLAPAIGRDPCRERGAVCTGEWTRVRS